MHAGRRRVRRCAASARRMGSDRRSPSTSGGHVQHRENRSRSSRLLAAVLTASVLDLFLGVLWILALTGRAVAAAGLRLGGVAGAAPRRPGCWSGAAGSAGSRPPAPATVRAGLDSRLGRTGDSDAVGCRSGQRDPADAGRASGACRACAREELRLTGRELEQRRGRGDRGRAGVSIRCEARPRGEAAAVEASAARRLAAHAWRRRSSATSRRRRHGRARVTSTDLDRRLRGAPATRAEAADRAPRGGSRGHGACVAPPACAKTAPPRTAAMEALVRALGGGVPTAATTASARYADERKEIALGGALPPWPALRASACSGSRRGRSGHGGASQVHAGGPGVRIGNGGPASRPARSVAGARAGAARCGRRPGVGRARGPPVQCEPCSDPVAFERLDVAPSGAADDIMITVVLDGRPGTEIPLAVRLFPPRLARVTVPRYALYFASRPRDGDARSRTGTGWEPAGDGGGPLRAGSRCRGRYSCATRLSPVCRSISTGRTPGTRRGGGRTGGARAGAHTPPASERGVEGS